MALHSQPGSGYKLMLKANIYKALEREDHAMVIRCHEHGIAVSSKASAE